LSRGKVERPERELTRGISKCAGLFGRLRSENGYNGWVVLEVHQVVAREGDFNA
jgi:sugar phosphate isomerase/epimerase